MPDTERVSNLRRTDSQTVWRPFHSLQWRLQAWYALVLVSVLAVLGVVIYVTSWQIRLQQIDAELDRTAEVLTSRLRRLFPFPPSFRGPGRWPSRGAEFGNRSDQGAPLRSGTRERDQTNSGDGNNESASRPGTDQQQASNVPRPNDRSPSSRSPNIPESRSDRGSGSRRETSDEDAVSALNPVNVGRDARAPSQFRGSRGDEFAGPPPAPPGGWSAPSLGLPEEYSQLFEGDEETRLYFIIWDHQGKVLQKSESAPDVEFPGLKVGEDRLPVRSVRLRGLNREVIHVSSFDINLLVGRSIVRDLAAHYRFSLFRLLVGVAVLVAGLLGGWWSTARAIRPIATMASTAESISAGSLSQRIDVTGTDTELEQLATVLNHTFDRLQAAFEQQTQFTSDASHELRTPLSVILANADLALSRNRTPEEYRASLETCRQAARRMKKLIDELLKLSRFDEDAAELRSVEFDIDELISECVQLVKPLAADRGITIESQLESFSLWGDRERFSQVIVNLLTNAIRYNRDGGSIRIEAALDGQEAVITVADSGIGIAETDLPHIFDRFYRVDKARTRVEGGSGLGLAICRTIVVAHGGTITARSQLDVGTTVEVRIPTEAAKHFQTPTVLQQSVIHS